MPRTREFRSNQLTKIELETFKWAAAFTAQHGRSPSIGETARHFGKDKSTIRERLAVIAHKQAELAKELGPYQAAK